MARKATNESNSRLGKDAAGLLSTTIGPPVATPATPLALGVPPGFFVDCTAFDCFFLSRKLVRITVLMKTCIFCMPCSITEGAL